MGRTFGFALFLLSGCVHSPNRAPLPERSQRDPAFFDLFSANRTSPPTQAGSPLPAPPSSLAVADLREMALFYDRWAFQFRQAVQNYQSAAKEYKSAARHFKKMSGHTRKKQDHLFLERFQKVERNLRAADGFLERAEKLRTTRPAFGRSSGAAPPP